MPRKVVIVCDPGIDSAFAVTLALFDPELEVLGLAATAGNVPAEQATKNVHIVVENLDPPRWPRLGAALPVEYEVDGTALHGPEGLGAATFPCAQLHHPHPSDKLIGDIVRQFPDDVTIISMGPLTVLARAIDLFPEIVSEVSRIVCLGGTMHEPGNAGPASEFHFFCDPPAARKVIQSGAPLTLVPLDVMRKVLFSPTDLLNIPADSSPACAFLRRIVPYGIAQTANLYGIEGFHLKDVLGVIAVAEPGAIETQPMCVDVETRGELTRGMTVIDRRQWQRPRANIDVATDVDTKAVHEYIDRILHMASS